MIGYSKTILEKCRPNGWYIALVKYTHDDGAVYYEVQEGGDEGFESEFEDFDSAKSNYDERVAELMNTPNWQLQAEYDALHGTDNGYDPSYYEREY